MNIKQRILKVCQRCGHQWLSHIEPKTCAKCRSPYWDKPRKEMKQ